MSDKSPEFHALVHDTFQRSFAVATQVRTSTDIGAHSISMAAAAVRLVHVDAVLHRVFVGREGAELVLLPELHLGPYFCQTEDTGCFDLAEPIPGPTTEVLGRLAAELGVVIVASLFEKRAPGLYHNTAVVFERDGRMVGIISHVPELRERIDARLEVSTTANGSRAEFIIS